MNNENGSIGRVICSKVKVTTTESGERERGLVEYIEGECLAFGVNYDEFSAEGGSYSVAIVMFDTGEVEAFDLRFIRFLDPDDIF